MVQNVLYNEKTVIDGPYAFFDINYHIRNN
jgi:hypothetical protein